MFQQGDSIQFSESSCLESLFEIFSNENSSKILKFKLEKLLWCRCECKKYSHIEINDLEFQSNYDNHTSLNQ